MEQQMKEATHNPGGEFSSGQAIWLVSSDLLSRHLYAFWIAFHQSP